MSYDLNRVRKEFREACLLAKVEIDEDFPINLNGRLTRTLGYVRQEYSAKTKRYTSTKVEFSRKFIENGTDESIAGVIKHEAAHYIVTARTGVIHNHDEVFQTVCAEIGTPFDAAKSDVKFTCPEEQLYKYSVFCPHCNEVIANYSRMCKTLRQIKLCRCNKCNQGDLKVITNW